MTIKPFEVVDHTADWALRVFGRDWPQLLAHAAQGMNSLLVADPVAIPLDEQRRIEITAFDSEGLLVEWLSELAYWAEEKQLVFPEHEFHQVTRNQLQGTVRGGRALELLKHIKAVTYHNLEIIETEDGLEATVVFDV